MNICTRIQVYSYRMMNEIWTLTRVNHTLALFFISLMLRIESENLFIKNITVIKIVNKICIKMFLDRFYINMTNKEFQSNSYRLKKNN